MSEHSRPKFTHCRTVPGGDQIQATVWETDLRNGEESTTCVSVTIQRRSYSEEEKKWKSACQFRESDLLTLAFVIQELYRRLDREKQNS